MRTICEVLNAAQSKNLQYYVLRAMSEELRVPFSCSSTNKTLHSTDGDFEWLSFFADAFMSRMS